MREHLPVDASPLRSLALPALVLSLSRFKDNSRLGSFWTGYVFLGFGCASSWKPFLVLYPPKFYRRYVEKDDGTV